MSDKKQIDRRSFMARVMGGIAVGGALGTVAGCAGTDSDPYDLAGLGRGMTAGGCSDSDSGYGEDQVGNGRRCGTPGPAPPPSNCSDSDSGRSSDGIGQGRRCGPPPPTNCSDSDSGRYGDPEGNGRRCGAPAPSNCSDSDSGRGSDPTGRGRRCG